MSDNKAPDPMGTVQTIRVMCSHGVSEPGPLDEVPVSVSMAVATFTELLMGSDHYRGCLFDENTDNAFAVIKDYDGNPVIVWNFLADKCNYGEGELEFKTAVDVCDWALYSMKAMAPDMAVVLIDENGATEL